MTNKSFLSYPAASGKCPLTSYVSYVSYDKSKKEDSDSEMTSRADSFWNAKLGVSGKSKFCLPFACVGDIYVATHESIINVKIP